MPSDRFWRDFSGRLTFDLPGVGASDYLALSRALADALDLVPAGECLIGPDQMFWEFRRGDLWVSLDWDNWMEFMAVAKSEEAEPLVREIAAWLCASAWSAHESDRSLPAAPTSPDAVASEGGVAVSRSESTP